MSKALAAVALLALAGCDDTANHAEGRAEFAADQSADNTRRIAALESEIETLKAKQGATDRFAVDTFNTVASYEKVNDANISALFSNERIWRDNISYLRELQGRPPLPEPTKK